ncbi:MAG: CRISPR-associated protein Cas4 [Chloroflexi bacterium]|nr:CRISPR-associated protein Cas4 [Chloroflexota bacterium]
MSQLVLILFFLLLIAALALWLLSRRTRERAGLPVGEVVYADTGAWQRNERPLFSKTYQLTGKPDYLVRDGRRVIPVEVKSRSAPASPYRSHVMQLAAYCLLVEDALGASAPYGFVHYRDKTFRVEFTSALRAELLSLLVEMREAQHASVVHRDHDVAARCARCGFQEMCGESLALSAER